MPVSFAVRVDYGVAPVPGRLAYSCGDFAFGFEYDRPIVPSVITFVGGLATLCLQSLEVDIHVPTGRWMGVSGYTNWFFRELRGYRPV